MMPKSRLGNMKINIIAAKSREKWVESQKFAKVQVLILLRPSLDA